MPRTRASSGPPASASVGVFSSYAENNTAASSAAAAGTPSRPSLRTAAAARFARASPNASAAAPAAESGGRALLCACNAIPAPAPVAPSTPRSDASSSSPQRHVVARTSWRRWFGPPSTSCATVPPARTSRNRRQDWRSLSLASGRAAPTRDAVKSPNDAASPPARCTAAAAAAFAAPARAASREEDAASSPRLRRSARWRSVAAGACAPTRWGAASRSASRTRGASRRTAGATWVSAAPTWRTSRRANGARPWGPRAGRRPDLRAARAAVRTTCSWSTRRSATFSTTVAADATRDSGWDWRSSRIPSSASLRTRSL